MNIKDKLMERKRNQYSNDDNKRLRNIMWLCLGAAVTMQITAWAVTVFLFLR